MRASINNTVIIISDVYSALSLRKFRSKAHNGIKKNRNSKKGGIKYNS